MVDIVIASVIIGLICGGVVVFFTDDKCMECDAREERINRDSAEERLANNIAKKVEQIIMGDQKNG